MPETQGFIYWDMTCNSAPMPCGGVATQNQTCASTQTWFWVVLAGIAAFSILGGNH